jgi:flagellar basal-body rod modification protein FlgD
MTVTPPEATGAFGLSTPTSAASPTGQLDQDTFLKLLVAQLKYQDPLNPADSTEFLSQTAQFSSLEKMGNVADTTSAMVVLQTAFGASSLVGKGVTYLDADGNEQTGTVDSVRFENNGVVLHIGDAEVALSAIVSVAAPGTTPVVPPATRSTDTTTTSDPAPASAGSTDPTASSTA